MPFHLPPPPPSVVELTVFLVSEVSPICLLIYVLVKLTVAKNIFTYYIWLEWTQGSSNRKGKRIGKRSKHADSLDKQTKMCDLTETANMLIHTASHLSVRIPIFKIV